MVLGAQGWKDKSQTHKLVGMTGSDLPRKGKQRRSSASTLCFLSLKSPQLSTAPPESSPLSYSRESIPSHLLLPATQIRIHPQFVAIPWHAVFSRSAVRAASPSELLCH